MEEFGVPEWFDKTIKKLIEDENKQKEAYDIYWNEVLNTTNFLQNNSLSTFYMLLIIWSGLYY